MMGIEWKEGRYREAEDRPLVLKLTPEQRAARQPLVDAGNRILSLLYQISDQATEEQIKEAHRQHRSLCAIWNDALVEPID
jgi:DNA-binding MarR family transcriptional regulator